MNRGVHKRIRALEAVTVVSCPTCRFWNGSVLRDDEGHRSRAERCPDCGRVVPIWHELHLVGIPLDLP
jgi:predicted RNA-binding Zn-ribbon protein involved in translation (DUF1610 family)